MGRNYQVAFEVRKIGSIGVFEVLTEEISFPDHIIEIHIDDVVKQARENLNAKGYETRFPRNIVILP